jgi:hypothetical protein
MRPTPPTISVRDADSKTMQRVAAIYQGSDGDATKDLYGKLIAHGSAGVVALNLFRAHKCSARAKVYRGGNSQGSYRDMAYDRKEYSIGNLAAALTRDAAGLGIRWGWLIDPNESAHAWVLYVDLPEGQVSFHTGTRGPGPDYAGVWDGARGTGAERIARHVARVLDAGQAP